jgi:AraC family transcriptional regulator, regulatory protein of adaptative response / methylated-DNA-[protein]-cysteine methyltransferase
MLKASYIDTPLGPMLAAADDKALFLLEFGDRRGWEKKKTNRQVVPGKTEPIEQIEAELTGYFSGITREFRTPLCPMGSPFRKRVWEELQKISFGQTTSYGKIAAAIGKPAAFRAIALANGANRFAIVIPCHRVIYGNGGLGGYGGGLEKKEWLLKHEQK